MSVSLIDHSDPRAFYDAAIGHLMQSEAECCAQIGLAERMRKGYQPISIDELDHPILWTVQDGSRIELVAIQTLKDKMIVTRGSPETIECLAGGLVARSWRGGSLIGVMPSIQSLVEQYSSLSGRERRLIVRLRVFQLDRVTWPKPISGQMRLSQSEDRELIARYMMGFETDVGEKYSEDHLKRADRVIGERRMYVWVDDSKLVAMAAWAGPTLNGIRVNWVYTSPESRGRGYASNLVAHLTQQLLDQGRKFTFLFTDLSNPTSNSIYQKIGYRPVSDSERWEFAQPVAK